MLVLIENLIVAVLVVIAIAVVYSAFADKGLCKDCKKFLKSVKGNPNEKVFKERHRCFKCNYRGR